MSYNQQPVANPGMTVGGGNRNAKNLPVDADGRDYSHGLFECLDEPITCKPFCIYYLLFLGADTNFPGIQSSLPGSCHVSSTDKTVAVTNILFRTELPTHSTETLSTAQTL